MARYSCSSRVRYLTHPTNFSTKIEMVDRSRSGKVALVTGVSRKIGIGAAIAWWIVRSVAIAQHNRPL
jgi:hypothetical protein